MNKPPVFDPVEFVERLSQALKKFEEAANKKLPVKKAAWT